MKTENKILFLTLIVMMLVWASHALAETNVIKYGGVKSAGFIIDESGNVSIAPDKGAVYKMMPSSDPALSGFLVQDAAPSNDFNGQVTLDGQVLTKPTTDPGPNKTYNQVTSRLPLPQHESTAVPSN